MKLWQLPEGEETVRDGASLCNPLCTVAREARRVDCALWNPVIDGALALAVHQTVKVYDVSTQSCVNGTSHPFFFLFLLLLMRVLM